MSLLPDAESFRRLVDGRRRGPGPALARAGLAALAAPYAAAVAVRNTAYDRGWLAIHAAGVPVVSVGNLTLGGTGKTPLVAWMVRELAARGRRPAIVSRGYGARRGVAGDEAEELALVVPGVPHVADRDRVAAARRAAAAGADVLVLDDGFQHRRLARDLDIVAIDATDPFGTGRIFPRGLLREHPAGLVRAGAVVLTRASAVDAARRAEIRDAVVAARGGAEPEVWAEAEHRPLALRGWHSGTRPLADLAGARIVAFAGIGNPVAFRATLEGLDADVAEFHAFADHHAYGPEDLGALARRTAGADLVVTTLKDLVKLRCEDLGGVPLVAVEVALEPLVGGAALAARVAAILR